MYRSQTTVPVSISRDAKLKDLQNRGDQACRKDSSGVDVSISYFEIAGFTPRLGSVPLVIATELKYRLMRVCGYTLCEPVQIESLM